MTFKLSKYNCCCFFWSVLNCMLFLFHFNACIHFCFKVFKLKLNVVEHFFFYPLITYNTSNNFGKNVLFVRDIIPRIIQQQQQRQSIGWLLLYFLKPWPPPPYTTKFSETDMYLKAHSIKHLKKLTKWWKFWKERWLWRRDTNNTHRIQ